MALERGERGVNRLSQMVFEARHPEWRGRKLRPEETELVREWRQIRDTMVLPALRPPSGIGAPPAVAPSAAPVFADLVAEGPRGIRFRYHFTPDDLLWTARFVVGEAGGGDTPANHAVLWAMFNRFARYTHASYPTFHQFLRAYSTPLQSPLINAGATRRHKNDPDFVPSGGSFAPPNQDVPRGQLKRFLVLQQTPWPQLPPAARRLAERALRGEIANPVGKATEFDSTFVYFKDRYHRPPSVDEWKHFTEEYARQKGWQWIGETPGIDQRDNAFFVNPRIPNVQTDSVRVLLPR